MFVYVCVYICVCVCVGGGGNLCISDHISAIMSIITIYYYLCGKACVKRHKLSRKYENWTMINNARNSYYPRDISFLLLLLLLLYVPYE